jgi:hypothetical protein
MRSWLEVTWPWHDKFGDAGDQELHSSAYDIKAGCSMADFSGLLIKGEIKVPPYQTGQLLMEDAGLVSGVEMKPIQPGYQLLQPVMLIIMLTRA